MISCGLHLRIQFTVRLGSGVRQPRQVSFSQLNAMVQDGMVRGIFKLATMVERRQGRAYNGQRDRKVTKIGAIGGERNNSTISGSF